MLSDVYTLFPVFEATVRRTDAELDATVKRAMDRLFAWFEDVLPEDTTEEDLQTAMGCIIHNRAQEFAYTYHGAWRLFPTGERRDALQALEDKLVMDATTVLIGLGLTRKEPTHAR